MVIPRDGVLAGLEKKLGLPKLSQITGSLEKFPDEIGRASCRERV